MGATDYIFGPLACAEVSARLSADEVQMNIRAKLVEICDAFNAHDLDRIMGFFADDCVLEMPKGSKPYGSRFEGGTMSGKDWLHVLKDYPTSITGMQSILWTWNLKPAFRNGASPAPAGMARGRRFRVATSIHSARAK